MTETAYTAHEYLFGMGRHTLSIETQLLILDVSSHYPKKKYTSSHLSVIFIILKRIQHLGWTPHKSSPRFMLFTLPTACWIFVKISTGLIAFVVFEHVWWEYCIIPTVFSGSCSIYKWVIYTKPWYFLTLLSNIVPFLSVLGNIRWDTNPLGTILDPVENSLVESNFIFI